MLAIGNKTFLVSMIWAATLSSDSKLKYITSCKRLIWDKVPQTDLGSIEVFKSSCKNFDLRQSPTNRSWIHRSVWKFRKNTITMEILVAPVHNITLELEQYLAAQVGAMPLPFPGMDKSGAAVCDFYSRGSCAKAASCPLRHLRGDKTVRIISNRICGQP